MDLEDIRFTNPNHACGNSVRKKRNAFFKSLVNFGAGVVKVVDSAVSGAAGILGIEAVNSPLACLIYGEKHSQFKTVNIGDELRKKPELSGFFTSNKELDLSKLTEAFETNSLSSIREKLINVLGNVFAFLKELFRHTKKVFYILTMCLMITDGYK